MEHFKSKILTENTVGITPITGYAPTRNKSIVADIWLDWQQKLTNKPISREYPIGNYFADGFEPEGKIIYEFFGCRYHGCLNCYPTNRDNIFQLHENFTTNNN